MEPFFQKIPLAQGKTVSVARPTSRSTAKVTAKKSKHQKLHQPEPREARFTMQEVVRVWPVSITVTDSL